MDTFGSVWDAADEVADDQSLRALTSARMQVAPVWPFLAAAKDSGDFSNRLALAEDRIVAAAQAHDVAPKDLAASLVEDFRVLSAEASFYVEDGGKKVGGPYDTKADAQDAIDGGDVSGSNLKVEQDGDEDGETNDDDGDDDADDAPEADSDDSDDDDKGGNPFAKKESSLAEVFPVIALKAEAAVVHQPGETVFVDHFMGHDTHEGRKGVWAQVVASPGQHGHEDRADSHLLKPMAPGGTQFFHHFGGLNKKANWGQMALSEGASHDYVRSQYHSGLGSYPEPDHTHGIHSPFRPHRVYDSISSAINHLSGGPLVGSDNPQEHRDAVEEHAANLRGYNHCNSCDHVYDSNHPDHETASHKDVCPNCNDTDFHESVADVLSDSGHYSQKHERTTYDDDHGPDYHGLDGDNHGDPYGKHDNPRQASRKTALEDGVDPLQWVLQASPQGEGQAEKEAHHDEATTVRTATLVSLYRDVLDKSE